MVFGFRYLVYDVENSKSKFRVSNDLKFILCIMCATLIHTAAFIWILLYVAKKMDEQKVKWVATIFIVAFMILGSTNILITVLSKLGLSTRILAYLTPEYQLSSYRQYGIVVFVLFTFLVMMMIWYYGKQCVENKGIGLELYKKINIIILCIVPIILIYTSEVYRLQVGLAVINYSYATNCLDLSKKRKFVLKKTELLILLCLIMYVGYGVYDLVVQYNYETVFEPIFKNNILLNW